jgi:hypothetical protein
MRQAIATLILGALAGAGLYIEAWLDRRGLDRCSIAFLSLFTAGLAVLMVMLTLHFGRFV